MSMSMSMSNIEKKEEEERWSQGLPNDILQSLAQRLYCLYISDYRVFRQVCPFWIAAVDSVAVSYSSSSPHYLGSIEGWLILAAKHRYNNKTKAVNFFLNPVTHARVMIPSQSIITSRAPYSRCRLSFFKKVVASSPPTRLPMKQECQLIHHGPSLRPKTCSSLIKDIEILDGKLYAVTTVEQASAFLMVYDILPAHANGYRVHSKNTFRLFKLDYNKTNGGPPWEEVVDLGDRMLFLSDASSMFIEDKTLGKNCIFFAINDEGAGSDGAFGVHSLIDRNIKLLALPQDTSSTIINVFSRTLWFTPLPW
ncbi:uncharacterized protein LOC112185154 [Rosa chinensis]|uniref:uncharacterized protein LOC112185154 n=1 Tax=Rosa chinensis TaxID=74649 RepID=UPI000D08DF87|nr:uncharacterized protein LOC112185154 [Rosa chinensis]